MLIFPHDHSIQGPHRVATKRAGGEEESRGLQELEKSLEEQHVATLTTIAYHWNQACMGHEVTEVECSLKAIEFW